jgi:GNAT superfamily N-acetyltransferase
MRPEDYLVVPFREGDDVRGFDCGNRELDEFLATDEVARYRDEWYGYTFLVRRAKDWALAGYYTVAQDSLEIPDDWIHKRMSPTLGLRRIPAVLLGRLAVHRPFQGSGVGSLILKHIVTEELESPRPARVIRLTCYPESLDWYLRRGFDFISEKEQRKAGQPGAKPRLYFDLKALPASPNVRIARAD